VLDLLANQLQQLFVIQHVIFWRSGPPGGGTLQALANLRRFFQPAAPWPSLLTV
jgi:hypothetical protein